jgi:DNA repair exonuclease SbcCD nuclease subunit
MSKILFIGDPHLKITRFDLAQDFLSWVTGLILELKPDVVINLGDTFDSHAVVRSEIMNIFKKHVAEITEAGIPYEYILGNHDMASPTCSKYHALQPFDMERFRVIDTPTHDLTAGISYIPYIHNFHEFPVETQPICIAHQQFVGCDYGYYRPDVGTDADKVNANIIISGHIHKRQQFGKVIYPGTPFAQSVNDVNQEKGVMLFDTDTYACTYYDSPLPRYRGMKFEMAQDFGVPDMHEQIKANLNEDHWIIDMAGPSAELTAYINSKEMAELKKDYSIRIRTTWTNKTKEKVSIKATSMNEIINKYVNQVYDGSLDRGIIMDKVLEILEKTQ